MYESVIRPLLFRIDAERAHNLALRAGAIAGRMGPVKRTAHRMWALEDERLRTRIGGLALANPLGLAAGFDKNGCAIPILGAIGFGHIEIGSISAYPSNGNPQPRLFRLPRDEAIIVSYGVPNDGAPRIRRRLDRIPDSVPLGINLVKTNDPRHPAIEPNVYEDYAASFLELQSRASYVMLNLSCPNTPGDRDFFDDLSRIHRLLSRLAEQSPQLPILLKLKPTRDVGILREIVAITDEFPFVTGFAINLPAGKPAELTLSTPHEHTARQPGAVSGPPVRDLVDSILATLRSIIGPDSRYGLIAAGGVTNAEDAYRKLRLGASAVQLYTGLVYRGPRIVREILFGLLRLIERDQFENVAASIGVDVDD